MADKKNTHLVKPYAVGKNKRSLAFIIPNQIVKEHNMNPEDTYFILKVIDQQNMTIKIISPDDLDRKMDSLYYPSL